MSTIWTSTTVKRTSLWNIRYFIIHILQSIIILFWLKLLLELWLTMLWLNCLGCNLFHSSTDTRATTDSTGTAHALVSSASSTNFGWSLLLLWFFFLDLSWSILCSSCCLLGSKCSSWISWLLQRWPEISSQFLALIKRQTCLLINLNNLGVS